MSKYTNRDIQNTPSNIDNEGLSWVQKPFSHPNRIIRLATSFSGIGAIEYAFKRLGLNSKIVFAGDIDANCKKTYFANYDIKEEQWHTDIHNFNARPYRGKVDLFVGGAPCQTKEVLKTQEVHYSESLRELSKNANQRSLSLRTCRDYLNMTTEEHGR